MPDERRSVQGRSRRLIVLLLAVLLAACGPASARPVPAPTPEPEPERVVALGAILDLGSGPGPRHQTAMQAAVERVNARGGLRLTGGERRPLRLFVYDTGGDPRRVGPAVRQLVERDGVTALVGPAEPVAVGIARRLAEELATPLIALGEPDDRLTRDLRWSFTLATRDEDALGALVEYLRGSNLDRIGWLAPRTATTLELRRQLSLLAARTGLLVTADALYPPGAEQLGPFLAQLQAASPNVILGWPRDAEETAAIAEAAATTAGLAPIFLGPGATVETTAPATPSPGADSRFRLRAVALRLAVSDDLWDHDPLTPAVRDFRREMTHQTGRPPSVDAALAWDAVRVLVDAVERSSPARMAVRDALEQVEDFPGASGAISFAARQHEGLDRRALVVARAEGRRWRLPP